MLLDDLFPADLSELTARILAIVPENIQIYLVGGAVRDLLLQKKIHDIDFVIPRDATRYAKMLANNLGAAYYPLDEARDTGRVIISKGLQDRWTLDFAVYRGDDLMDDIRGRDFTINAIAINLRSPLELVDPLNGLKDLHARRLSACSSSAFEDDPVRILRGVRFANQFDMQLEPETIRAMRESSTLINNVSPERIRDEFFRILSGPNPALAMKVLDKLGVLHEILPEVTALKGVLQSPPHIYDVWEHSLEVVQRLTSLLMVLGIYYDEQAASSLLLGMVSLRLGRYREQLDVHLKSHITPERSIRALLMLAALTHDTGKPSSSTKDETGTIHFYKHELLSEQIAHKLGKKFRLSSDEIDRLTRIVHNHMRLHQLVNTQAKPSRRAVYRYFRATGAAGVDICLLSLADVLATYGVNLKQDLWGKYLDFTRLLLEAWWEQPQASVNPPSLIDGTDLMNTFNLESGPVIGQILEKIREAQACGEIDTTAQALELARNHLANYPDVPFGHG